MNGLYLAKTVDDIVPDALQDEVAEAFSHAVDLYQQMPVILSRLITAGIVIVLGVLFIRLCKRLIAKGFAHKAKRKPASQKQTDTVRSLMLSVFSYLSWFFIIATALSIMGVDVTSLLTVAGISGIAIGFGAQTLIKDVISGMFLWSEGHVAVGDVVSVVGQTGTVENISLRTTVLRLTNGALVSVPNGDIRTVVNMTRDFRVAQVDVTVAHGQDYQAAQDAIADECALLKQRLSLTDAPKPLGYIGNDARAATLRVECGCDTRDVWTLEREIRAALFQRLFKENIRP